MRRQRRVLRTTYAHLIYYFQTLFTSKCVFLSKVAAPFNSLLLPPQYYFFHGRTSYSKSYGKNFLLQRPVNCQPCYWAPNSQSRKRNLKQKENYFFQNFLIFFKNLTFQKTARAIEHLQNKVFSPHLFIYVYNFLHSK